MCRQLAQRIVVAASIAGMALLVPACTPAQPAADLERIVAVGDVHGDYDQFVRTLRAAEVIDESNNWIGGRTRLVQVGDVLDRGPDSRKVMDLLMSLEQQAPKAGGAVHALIGNHEAMVVMGDWRYVSPEEMDGFGGEDEYEKAMGAEGKYGRWIRSHDAVIKVNGLLFAHAGLRDMYAGEPLAQINEAIRRQLAVDAAEGPASDPEGPLWTRFLAIGDEDEVAAELDAVLEAYGASHMIVGHTVDTAGITSRAGGRLIRIDVGLSRVYGGPAACLVVENGVFYEVRATKARRRLDIQTPAPLPAPQEQPAERRKAA